MKTTFYKKVGRKYIPVSEYDEAMGMSEGHYLVHVRPGSTSYRYKLNPEYCNLDAAIEEFKDFLIEAIRKESEMRPIQTKMSPKEQKAWDAFKNVMGDEIPTYFAGFESYQKIVDNALEKLKEKIIKK